ncbi:inosine 5'-monophosphate dehydrogenase [Symmachiella macrocystis]|uniref:Inosine 5'-monophosphate dehydrogenase n=1 Tax=Symmachiella macrocystis TaxID=2527985 RepID=A0A5C6BUB4_9PLAN|nr:CBS domain-containing protein [Symmachiella macrocystis]TWU14319.1 inosine 5'-monophosphate dehydrogenase [Symmachiella macrocystis]
MANEKQNETPFQDPLENYDPPTFDDPIEQALHEETVMAIQSRPYACVPIDTTVEEVLQTLVGEGIACVLIENQGKLMGLVSDRDILEKVALEYDDVKNKSVREVMTASPIYVDESESAASALAVMAVSGYRHVPVVDLKENIVGIVSPQRVTKFLRKCMDDQ